MMLGFGAACRPGAAAPLLSDAAAAHAPIFKKSRRFAKSDSDPISLGEVFDTTAAADGRHQPTKRLYDES